MESYYNFILRQLSEKYPTIGKEIRKTMDLFNEVLLLYTIYIVAWYNDISEKETFYIGHN